MRKILISAIGSLWLGMAPSASAQTIPSWGRVYNAAEVRDLRGRIVKAAREEHIAESTLDAVARYVGSRYPRIGAQALLGRIDALARQAGAASSQIESLRQELREVRETSFRDPAERALARADTAFREGRLTHAEAELAGLEKLRGSQLATSQRAWQDSVEARARLAELGLDYDRSTEIRLTAMRLDETASLGRQFAFAMDAGWTQLRKPRGDSFGGRGIIPQDAPLLRAASIFRDYVVPLATRLGDPEKLARARCALGKSLVDRVSIDAAQLKEAHDALAAAQSFIAGASQAQWWRCQGDYAAALARLGTLTGDDAMLASAADAYGPMLRYWGTQDACPIDSDTRGYALAEQLVARIETGGAQAAPAGIDRFLVDLDGAAPSLMPQSWATRSAQLRARLAAIA